MKMYFKQRFFSWFDSYDIYDENNNVIYVVKGELSWGHKLRISDANKTSLGIIKEKILTFLPKYILCDMNEQEIGMICKEFTFFKPKYDLTCNGWHVEGDFWNWNYNVVDSNGELIASIQKKLLHLTDQYEIDVVEPKNSLLVLMIVLGIDIDKCRQQQASND